MKLTIEEIASVAHEANRALQVVLNDPAIPVSGSWHEISEHMRDSTRVGVQNIIDGIVAAPEESHEMWMRHKLAAGWTYGVTKSEQMKFHPLLVPYNQLSVADRLKDELFFNVVSALGCSRTANDG